MDLKNSLLIMGVALSPFVELRGAIPLGLKLGFEAREVFLLAVCGNLLIVLPLFFFLKFCLHQLSHISIVDKFFCWWFGRIAKKTKLIEKYGFWGLILFVGIPLPGTGAWSGSLAAVFLRMKARRAIPAICLGVILAGILVSLISNGVLLAWAQLAH